MSSTPWIANQLLRMADGRQSMKLEVPRYNPRPPGVIREGGATDAVLTFLQSNPKRFFCHHEIQVATKKTKVSIDWALCYLRAQLLIEATSDESRNSRYLRYRVMKDKP